MDYENGKEEKESRAPSGADGDGVEAAGCEGKSAGDGGDLGSESVWTTGTLTSRG